MAEDIREGVEIVFSDKVRKIYPVSLRKLRDLNKVLTKIRSDVATTEVTDEDITLMVEAATIALNDDKLTPDKVEDIVDVKTFNSLISAAMGTDPNELGATQTV